MTLTNRQNWSIQLDDWVGTTINFPTVDAMYVEAYDLGFPSIREVRDPIADGNGETDLTRWFGPRTLTLDVRCTGSHLTRQTALGRLRRMMDPRYRATIKFDNAFTDVSLAHDGRTFGVGVGAGFSAPVPSGAAAQTARMIWRIPSGFYEADFLTTTVAITQNVSVNISYGGSATLWPILTLRGPATNPTISAECGEAQGLVAFSSLVVPALQDLVIDPRNRTAVLNGVNVFSSINFATLVWPFFDPGAAGQVLYAASGTTAASRLTVTWRDAYL